MSTTNEIRSQFLDYFRRHDHEEVSSSPLVPRNDPTLLFTNAGMVQFKNVFTGEEHRPYNRAVTSQKCVRAGGKHNDLENVGYTARHHTFFEMLGNFSFGDYFKERAIELAWQLVTKEFGLPADRLVATVYAEDDQAYNLWKKIAGLPDERILRIATSDNFWAMGDTGPCGPCSEIFFDHGPDVPGGPPGSPDEDGDRFIEIWNLVFMQYDQPEPGQKVDLPRPSIDTGMGLERIAAVLQGKHDNYDIDLFRRLIETSGSLSGVDPDGPHHASHKVIADHLRATAFLLADGVMPSNEGRGYVLRRIMRRAMRHVHKLGVREPILWRMVPELVNEMGGHFQELRRAEALVTETLKMEESRFQETLDRGLKLLSQATARLPEGGTLPGDTAFKLYDTYGFPLDLTRDILRGQDLGLDEAGFTEAMERQRAAARKSWSGSGEAAWAHIWFDLRDRLGATEFLGYDHDSADASVLALVRDGEIVDAVEAGENVEVVVNQTPFYGESGGQIGDIGTIQSPDARLEVADTQKKVGDLHVHTAKVVSGTLRTGDAVHLTIDAGRRRRLRAHHSATHLLHEALRRRLGEHVTQKGSRVAPERLRFDVSQPTPIGADDLVAVEQAVNAAVRENTEVTTRIMSQEDATAAGALALFGEKYGEEVRVVSMGGQAPDANRPYSIELCGGTHVRRTGDIGFFKIVREEGLAAGVRRIEAVAHAAAEDFVRDEEATLRDAAAALRTTPGDLTNRLTQLLDERKRLERDLAETRKKLATGDGGGGTAEAPREVGGVRLSSRVVADVPPKDLKPMADEMKKAVGSGVVVVVTGSEGKASIVVGVTDDLTDNLSAVDLVRVGAQALGGKGGGGRPDMAQAGGPDSDAGAAAVAAIEDALSTRAAA